MGRPSLLRQTLPVLAAIVLGVGVVVLAGHREAPGETAPYFPPWHLDPSSPKPPEMLGPNVPRTIEDLRRGDPETGERCREGARTQAFILLGDRLVHQCPNEELMTLAGSREIPSPRSGPGAQVGPGRQGGRGRRDSQWAVPLVSLLSRWPDAKALEVWPCRGDPRRFEAADLRADPDRWLLVLTNRGFLKLVDGREDARQPVLRGLAAFRVLP